MRTLARVKLTAVAATACLAASLIAPAMATTPPTRALNTGYVQYTGPIVALPVGKRVYDGATITPVQGFGVRDSTGVRMAWFDNKLQNHPTAQAEYALQNLNSYRLTANTAYLNLAELNAQRLIDTAVTSAGAWYFPYRFTFAPLHDASQQLLPPWYSAMAQGQALSVFTRLYLATNDQKWRAAADHAFLSLAQAPAGRAPNVSYLDTTKHLWLEEYPRYPSAAGEKVLNGHIFAIYGLLDYWQLTRSPQALSLARGAIATVQATVMSQFRRVNNASVYSLRHKTPAGSYHRVVIEQFLQLLAYTQRSQFAQMADAFMTDYPDYPLSTVSGTAMVTPKETKIYQLNAAGAITATKTVHFTRLTSFPANARVRITNGPIALHDTTGAYANWYFPEGPALAWLNGAANTVPYPLKLTVRIAPGNYSAYQLNSAGVVIATKTVRFTQASSAVTTMSGTVRARPCFYLTSGDYAGYWLPMQTGVHL